MAQIALTLTDGGAAVKINDTEVVSFSANSSTGSLVKYVNEGAILKTIDVTESPSAVQALSPLFIELTAVDVVFPSATVAYNTLSGTFLAGEKVVFGQSSANAAILTDNGSNSMVVQQISGANIATTQAIRGIESGATAAVNGAPTYAWNSSTTFYLNSGRIISIAETGYSATRTILYADNESPAGNVQYVSESLAAIVTAAGAGNYVTLGGTQTVTGDKTFSGTTTLSGTNTITGTATVTKAILVKSNVTQGTSKTTTVVTTATAGTITTFALSDAAGTSFQFTVTNANAIATSDIQLTVDMNSSTGLAYCTVTKGAGSFIITVYNIDVSAAFNAAIKIDYLIL
jgi:hypothetical protein